MLQFPVVVQHSPQDMVSVSEKAGPTVTLPSSLPGPACSLALRVDGHHHVLDYQLQDMLISSSLIRWLIVTTCLVVTLEMRQHRNHKPT